MRSRKCRSDDSGSEVASVRHAVEVDLSGFEAWYAANRDALRELVGREVDAGEAEGIFEAECISALGD